MPQIIETTVYQIHELPDDAKDRARAWYRESAGDWDWYDPIYDDFDAVCGLLGVTLKTRAVRLYGGGTREKPCIWFSGFWSQGDGACFEGRYRYVRGAGTALRQYAPLDRDLHKIADQLHAAQRRNFYQLTADVSHRGPYCHARSMDITIERGSPTCQPVSHGAEDLIADALRDLADWLYRQLEREWDHLMSDAYADDFLEANAYLFTADGGRFHHA